jgi:hypothetical protein
LQSVGLIAPGRPDLDAVLVTEPQGRELNKDLDDVQLLVLHAFRLALGRGEDLDAVRGSELGEEDWIGRDGLGQSQVTGRLARSLHELVEPPW